MACAACHITKVKCINPDGFPCKRCKRLGIDCVLHKSLQGKGKKRPKTNISDENSNSHDGSLSMPSDDTTSRTATAVKRKRGSKETNHDDEFADAIAKPHKNGKVITESIVVAKAEKLASDHFGIYFIVRQWISFAITRRSFDLMGRACSLASKCGISMDDVICGCERFSSIPTVDEPISSADGGTNNTNPLFMALAIRTRTSHGQSNGMDFFPTIAMHPGKDQKVIGPALRLVDIPLKLLSSIYCCPSLSNLSGRWVLVREMKKGMSSFYASEQFEQDIAPYDLICQTYQENRMEVKHLWTKDADAKYKHSQGLFHQISLQRTFDTLPHPARICNTKITLRNGQEIACDCIICMVIVGLDHCYYFVEYHSPRPVTDIKSSSSNAGRSGNTSGKQSNTNEARKSQHLAQTQNAPSEIDASRNTIPGMSNTTNVFNMATNLMLANNRRQQQSASNSTMNNSNTMGNHDLTSLQQPRQQNASSNQTNNHTNLQNNTSKNMPINSNMGSNMMQSNVMNMSTMGNASDNNGLSDYNTMVDDLEWSSDLDEWMSETEMKSLW